MIEKYYQFTCEANGYGLKLWLNDIIIAHEGRGCVRQRKYLANQYIIDGRNSVRLQIYPVKNCHKNQCSTVGSVKIRLDEIPVTTFSESLNATRIASVEYTEQNQVVYPIEFETDFSICSPFGRWVWQDAEQIEEFYGQNATLLHDFLHTLHAYFSAKNIDGVQHCIEIKNKEMARAFYVPFESRWADQEEYFYELFNDTQFSMEPLDTAKLAVEPMACGRLFSVTNTNGTAALESKQLSRGCCFSMPLILSKIDGALKIVR
ncbi:MAG: hypothetical protein JW795_00680 [Chitinivibrionales bacterium]|nr:hypothetical protein [Chitinivibrionales bacterium]